MPDIDYASNPRYIVVSYSELDTYRQCPLKHMLAYGQRWTRPTKPGSALSKGSLWHQVLETHYKVVQRHQMENGGKRIRSTSKAKMILNEAWVLIEPMLYDTTTGGQNSDQELIEWMYHGHVKMWGIDEAWIIKGVEHQILTPLRDERGRRTRFVLKAKIDLVVFDLETGSLRVVDHKSGAQLPSQMELEIDDQFGLYQWAMREMKKPVLGSIHNAARTQRNKSPMSLDSRMARTYLNRDEVELTALALDAYRTAWNAHPPKGRGPKIMSSPDPRQCGWKCDFKEPHLLMRRGRKPSEVLTEYGFKIDRTRH